MAVRIGILSTAHMHAHGYAVALRRHPNASFSGVWDDVGERGLEFAERYGVPFFAGREELITASDGLVVTSENRGHADLVEAAAAHCKHVLCEKPIATDETEATRIEEAVTKSGIRFMTAFPCRFSPAFVRLKERVAGGDIGEVLAVCATNHGMCPFGWFVEPEKSGGGAMMDHTVHVADLLRNLLNSEPQKVFAQTNSLHFGKDFDDTAMLHVNFANGVFTTIDASWSRPKSYKTWGDVRMNVVGEKGVIELDMFAQAIDSYSDKNMRHGQIGYASDLDAALVAEFVRCIETDTEPAITLQDGLAAARVAIAGYRSARSGAAVDVA